MSKQDSCSFISISLYIAPLGVLARTMFAIHETLLAPSAIHYSLFLPNFTPSTIYPLPRPSSADAPEVKVLGNLVVAGGQDLRVFEIREESSPIPDAREMNGDPVMREEELGDSFFDNGPSEVRYDRMQSMIVRTNQVSESASTVRNDKEAASGL
jgi:hypothetical protein